MIYITFYLNNLNEKGGLILVRKFVKTFWDEEMDNLDKKINNFIPMVHNVISVSFSIDGDNNYTYYTAMVLYENHKEA